MGDRESEDRGYPAPPWHLQGAAFQMLQLVDSRRARLFVPYGLKIVSIWPGKTLGGIVLASYGSGSDLEYNELIAFPALVRCGSKWGVWISHIYVDNENSLLGGREIWGLPKQWAQFTQEETGRIVVRQGDETLCALEQGKHRQLWRQKLNLPAFSVQGTGLLYFRSKLDTRLSRMDARWEIPQESPFTALGFGQGGVTLCYEPMQIDVPAPKDVGDLSQT